MNTSGAAQFLVAADAYDGHVGRYSRELADRLSAVAGVCLGQQALDVGCGPGALTEVLAGLVGAGAVAAIDPSPPFVQTCRARVPGTDVQQAAAERLPFPDGAFDVVLSQLVVNFRADAATGRCGG